RLCRRFGGPAFPAGRLARVAGRCAGSRGTAARLVPERDSLSGHLPSVASPGAARRIGRGLNPRGPAPTPDKGRQVASMAYPEPEQRRANPITQHPAFPAVVALWFAALLGLGSLVLPAVLLERLVEMSGLASLVPAASPPRGFTARVLVALVAGAAGGALGLMLARRVAEASGVPGLPRRVRGAGETGSPLNVLDELGDDRVTNGHAPPLSRRRAALMADGEPTAAILAPPIPADLADDQEPLMLSDLAA